MAERECENCKKAFSYTPPTNYPDRRKYCDECSAARKAAYEQKKQIPIQAYTQPQISQPQAPNKQISTAQHDIVIQKTDKPHSYEFGKASNRHKVYYNTAEELKQHIEDLKALGFIEDENLINPEDFKG